MEVKSMVVQFKVRGQSVVGNSFLLLTILTRLARDQQPSIAAIGGCLFSFGCNACGRSS
jgi:hypothetical protein